MKLKRDSYNGHKNDHYRPRRLSAQQYRSRVAREYDSANKTIVNGETLGVRPTGVSYLPFILIRDAAHRHALLHARLCGDRSHVRESHTVTILAVLDPVTLEQLDEQPVTYEDGQVALREAECALSECPCEIHAEAVRVAKRLLSHLSLQLTLRAPASGPQA